MKIAVSAHGAGLDSGMDPRFGRCQYLIVVDTETMDYDSFANPSVSASGGAGIQAARFVAEKGIHAVVTGSIGPNAQEVLSSAGIRMFTGASGTVREVVEQFKAGLLQNARNHDER